MDFQDIKPASSAEDIPEPQIQEQNSPEPAQPPKPKKRRKLLVTITLLVFVIIGASLAYVFLSKNKEVAKPIETRTENPLALPIFGKAKRFYYVSGSKLVIYEPANGKKEIISIPLDGNRFINSTYSGVNKSVQISEDGRRIFYTSVKPKPSTRNGGEGEPKLESIHLSVLVNKAETKLYELKLDSGQDISDWVITPDGSRVYILTAGANKGNRSLHMLTTANKHDTVIVSKVDELGGINNPMFMSDDGSLRFFSNGAKVYSLVEHIYSAGKYTVRDLVLPCKCSLKGPQAISPDGKRLFLEEQTSGEEPADFNYYVYDVSSSKNTKIAGPLRDIQWMSEWSPGSKYMAYSTGGFGNNINTLIPELGVVRISDKKSYTLVSSIKSEAEAQTNFNIISWSTDGRYIAYTQDAKVKFYSAESKKTLELILDDETAQNVSYGWL